MLGWSLRAFYVGATLGLLLACGGRAIDDDNRALPPASAGESGAGFGAGSAAGSGGFGGSAAVAGAGGQSGLVGTWLGYVDDFSFNDGTNRISLTFDSESGAGKIRFGNSSEPAPATDPEATNPPDVADVSSGKPIFSNSPYAGAVFTILNPRLEAPGRLLFAIARTEVFDSWCKLQKPYPFQGGYNCVPDWGYFGSRDGCYQRDPATSQTITRSCFRLAMCDVEQVCSCSASGCSASLEASAQFELVFAPLEALGTVSGFTFDPQDTYPVHLNKSQPR